MTGSRIADRLLARTGARPIMISGGILTTAGMIVLTVTSAGILAGAGGYLPGIIVTMLAAGSGLFMVSWLCDC
jgi:hypothetical protein